MNKCGFSFTKTCFSFDFFTQVSNLVCVCLKRLKTFSLFKLKGRYVAAKQLTNEIKRNRGIKQKHCCVYSPCSCFCDSKGLDEKQQQKK